ncbi:MAG: pyridoxal 5'-phosphate synthase glutaminase subunit PdxT [Oscillospiraceae bacterium]|nr:pyridoxal 5'-phosphate synthase glutaminase subunit PdxT [Oscillospiraceae bacterium]
MRIGVLALQGAFIEHEKMLSGLGAECFEIRQLKDLSQPMDGLIIPGGESTVQGKLLRELEMMKPLRVMISSGLPVFGTCAGLILLAKEIEGGEAPHIAAMDITAKRNAYGRQLGSFSHIGDFKGIGRIPMTFIRAPYISRSDGAEILAEVNGKAVAARQDNMLATAFHPELTSDTSVHRYFLDIVRSAEKYSAAV